MSQPINKVPRTPEIAAALEESRRVLERTANRREEFEAAARASERIVADAMRVLRAALR